MLRADRRAADNVLLRCAKTRYGSAIALQGVHWHFPKHYSIRDNKNVLFFRIALVSFRRFTLALIARCSSSAHPPPSCSSATQALLRPYSSPAYSAHSAQVLRRLCSGTLLLLIQYLNHDWSFCHIDFVNFRPWWQGSQFWHTGESVLAYRGVNSGIQSGQNRRTPSIDHAISTTMQSFLCSLRYSTLFPVHSLPVFPSRLSKPFYTLSLSRTLYSLPYRPVFSIIIRFFLFIEPPLL